MANTFVTLAWCAKEALHICLDRVEKWSRMVRLIDGQTNYANAHMVDMLRENPLQITYEISPNKTPDEISQDLFDRIRQALLSERKVIIWNA